MDISNASRSAPKGTRGATGEKKRDAALSSFTGGLSAWLGGIAFCIGFGVVAPTWVALAVTVLSATAAVVSHLLLGRAGRPAARPAD